MTEKELVEKVRVRLEKKVRELKDSMERDGDKFEEYDETMTQLKQATQFKQLTNLVRDLCWDAESWMEFVLTTIIETEIEIGDLSGFDT